MFQAKVIEKNKHIECPKLSIHKLKISRGTIKATAPYLLGYAYVP
jgi:hypothetical protein